jgi:hypothetical protein
MYGEKTLLNAIMDCFEADAKECSRILNLMSDDISYNNSIEIKIGEFLYNLSNSLNTVTSQLQNKIDDIGFDVSNVDKLKEFLNTIR